MSKVEEVMGIRKKIKRGGVVGVTLLVLGWLALNGGSRNKVEAEAVLNADYGDRQVSEVMGEASHYLDADYPHPELDFRLGTERDYEQGTNETDDGDDGVEILTIVGGDFVSMEGVELVPGATYTVRITASLLNCKMDADAVVSFWVDWNNGQGIIRGWDTGVIPVYHNNQCRGRAEFDLTVPEDAGREGPVLFRARVDNGGVGRYTGPSDPAVVSIGGEVEDYVLKVVDQDWGDELVSQSMGETYHYFAPGYEPYLDSYLGSKRDYEKGTNIPDDNQSLNSEGTKVADNDGVGIRINIPRDYYAPLNTAKLVPGESYRLRVKVTIPGCKEWVDPYSSYLAWVDWSNGQGAQLLTEDYKRIEVGDWNSCQGWDYLDINVPENAGENGPMLFRFRASARIGTGIPGPADRHFDVGGEVEDYVVDKYERQIDYGDQQVSEVMGEAYHYLAADYPYPDHDVRLGSERDFETATNVFDDGDDGVEIDLNPDDGIENWRSLDGVLIEPGKSYLMRKTVSMPGCVEPIDAVVSSWINWGYGNIVFWDTGVINIKPENNCIGSRVFGFATGNAVGLSGPFFFRARVDSQSTLAGPGEPAGVDYGGEVEDYVFGVKPNAKLMLSNYGQKVDSFDLVRDEKVNMLDVADWLFRPMVCASYFRTSSEEDARMIQGTWTDDPEATASINSCLAYMQENVLNKPYCAQPGEAVYMTIVLIEKSRHTFDMPDDINMSTEFVYGQFCEVPQ